MQKSKIFLDLGYAYKTVAYKKIKSDPHYVQGGPKSKPISRVIIKSY